MTFVSVDIMQKFPFYYYWVSTEILAYISYF